MAVRTDERADVLPDDLALGRHFEQPPPLAFADQGVTPQQPLCAAPLGLASTPTGKADRLSDRACRHPNDRLGNTRETRVKSVAPRQGLAILLDIHLVCLLQTFDSHPGFTGEVLPAWYGLFAPARTPKAVVTRIYNAVIEIHQDPIFVERNLISRGLEPAFQDPDTFRDFLKGDRVRVGRMAAALKK